MQVQNRRTSLHSDFNGQASTIIFVCDTFLQDICEDVPEEVCETVNEKSCRTVQEEVCDDPSDPSPQTE